MLFLKHDMLYATIYWRRTEYDVWILIERHDHALNVHEWNNSLFLAVGSFKSDVWSEFEFLDEVKSQKNIFLKTWLLSARGVARRVWAS